MLLALAALPLALANPAWPKWLTYHPTAAPAFCIEAPHADMTGAVM
jgi:hypothetical protein